MATFVLRKPKDMSTASGVLWHDVPNRGGDVGFPADSFAAKRHATAERMAGRQRRRHVGAGQRDLHHPGCAGAFPHHYVQVPVLTGVTGRIIGRIVNRNGQVSAPLNVMGNPIPYFPADLTGNAGDVLRVHIKETVNGQITLDAANGGVVPAADWTLLRHRRHQQLRHACAGDDAAGEHLPEERLRSDQALPARATRSKNPYVLGVGTAAFRDVQSFFRYATADDFGTANPLAGAVKSAIMRGVSQSGNFVRHFILLGMNEDETGRIVHEGAWPLIAGRRVANNSRWGQPDGVLELYQMGSEGPQWWHVWPDQVREPAPGRHPRPLQASRTPARRSSRPSAGPRCSR